MNDVLTSVKAAEAGSQPASVAFTNAPYEHLSIPPFKLTKEKVAIVGFASTTRHLAPYDDDTWEIWGLNEAHRHSEWMRRITRWFQIHEAWDFQKQNDKSYQEHWEWLQKKQPFPIYMQQEWPEVPSSVKFPFQEICDKLLKTTFHGDRRTEYFTSSFAYMCSLALFLGAKEIGVWGFEMSTKTEFVYQKGSTEWWLGKADERCDRVQLTPNCRLLSGPKYGYEVSRMFNRQRIEMLQNHKKLLLEIHKAKVYQATGAREHIEKLLMSTPQGPLLDSYRLQAKEILEREINLIAKASEFAGQVGLLDAMLKELDAMKTVINYDPDADRHSADAILEAEDKSYLTVEATPDGQEAPSQEKLLTV